MSHTHNSINKTPSLYFSTEQRIYDLYLFFAIFTCFVVFLLHQSTFIQSLTDNASFIMVCNDVDRKYDDK